MKVVLVLAVFLTVALLGQACEFDEDCSAGTVCCAGECQTGNICCSYGACNSEVHCCSAGDNLWPACCDPASSQCCKNWGANWCCPNDMRCGSYFESCRRQTTTKPPPTPPAGNIYA